MTAERSIRASDQDRENAAQWLSEAYAVGRLNREELDERATAAYTAKTWGELRDLTVDLPPPAAPAGVVAARSADLRPIVLVIWSVVFPLAAGLAGPLSAVVFWVATLVTTTILLGRSSAALSDAPPGRRS
jgi:hypothetical protein